ncbi:MAG TPA: hypothetical protein VIV11_41925 [Kofleriaceae bacterium]
MARGVIFVGHMTELTSHQLARVVGGEDSFGRCGPGSSLAFLGNVRTPECLAHDQAVRNHLNNGSSYLGAQIKALPQFPAAAASWFRAKSG